ncbi:MAG: nucleotide sugar dehydrogenase [Armatimonadetes bacterium]|nr:nucleotide sugar dehydrogenase [Armatimonadota bacterium]
MTTHATRVRTSAADALAEKIDRRTARMGVIGLGYVGLPLALTFVEAGFPAVGFEVNHERLDQLANGESYISDVASEDLRAAMATGGFQASGNFDLLGEMDCILICVPTPLSKSKEPDISAIVAAGREIAARLSPGQLVVLESTTYPGTTEEVLQPMFEAGGLRVGEDVFLAFSPERVDPGNPNYVTRTIPKVVGGITPTCTRMTAQLYRAAIEQVYVVSSARVAETTKLLENTFRSVNIGLGNEMAILCRHLGIDVWEVIDAAATKPFGFMAHYPGPGIGGHCIPLDPYYLSWKARLNGYEAKLIGLASEINASMPRHVMQIIQDVLNDCGKCVRNARILLLGVAYKPNVSDTRESPALEILEMLHQKGAHVEYSDPFVPSLDVGTLFLRSVYLSPELLQAMDCVVIITNHKAFNYGEIVTHASLVVDTRNATRGVAGGQARVIYL